MSKAKSRKAIKISKIKKPVKAARRPARAKPAKIPARPRVAPPEAEPVVKKIKWSAAEMKEFRERLQKIHDLTAEAVGFLTRGYLSNPEGGSRQDKDEDGTETFAQELSLMRVSNMHDTLNKIGDAFRRLDQKTYGLCDQCGELIAVARLRVQPLAKKCVTCQSAAEAQRPRGQGFGRTIVQPVEEESA